MKNHNKDRNNKIVFINEQARGIPNPVKYSLILLALTISIVFPFIVPSQYIKHIAIISLSYISLGLSYDLISGRIGSVSLAHVAFFGAGAYTSSLVALKFGIESAFPRLFIVIVVALIIGIIIGIPSFRMAYQAFAMSTLAFSHILLIIITNWVEFTRGPLCLYAIPPLNFKLPFGISWIPKSIDNYYFVELGLAILTIWIVQKIANGRLGRSMLAIQEDQVLASMFGVPILCYKMFAFLVGATIASLAGAVYSSYTTVTCPSEFAFLYMVNLLIILFLGGRASTVGIILSAIIFTALPELLRIAESLRLLLYGILVVLTVLYFPDGISNVLNKIPKIFWPPVKIDNTKTESRVGEQDTNSKIDKRE